MKRCFVLFLCIVMLFSACACGARTDAENYARSAWVSLKAADLSPEKIFVKHYTSREALSEEELDTDMYDAIPESGYAILFHADATPNYYNSYAAFLDEAGNVKHVLDYEQEDAQFNIHYREFLAYDTKAGELALACISNCDYVEGLIDTALAEAASYQQDMQADTWYSFSEKQIHWVRKITA